MNEHPGTVLEMKKGFAAISQESEWTPGYNLEMESC